ncbi:MAG: glutamate racemase [Actinomycetota bacterium]|nr:glutamate racemase [Actinomycetota bacterium]
MDDRPVGIFDSGFGGLTVVKAIADLMPGEDLIYFGDSARYPYGPKPREEVLRYSLEICDFLIDSFDVKMIVVACNTASSFALDTIVEKYSLPIVGMIEPGAKSLVSAATSNRVGVIGTVGTISSGAYQEILTDIAPHLEVTCAATPGFVEFVERGELESDQLLVLAERLLRPILDGDVSSLLLGCTHYPFLARTISKVLGDGVTLISSAEETAFSVRQLLIEYLLVTSRTKGSFRAITSGDVEEFRRIGRSLLGLDFSTVTSHKVDR